MHAMINPYVVSLCVLMMGSECGWGFRKGNFLLHKCYKSKLEKVDTGQILQVKSPLEFICVPQNILDYLHK